MFMLNLMKKKNEGKQISDKVKSLYKTTNHVDLSEVSVVQNTAVAQNRGTNERTKTIQVN